MTDAIKVALIAAGSPIIVGLISLVAQIVLSRKTQESTMKEIEKRSEMTDAAIKAQVDTLAVTTNLKIDELTREVREHNGFAKRVPLLELKVDVMDKQIQSLRGDK